MNSEFQLLRDTWRNGYNGVTCENLGQALQDVIANWRRTVTDPVTSVILIASILLTGISGPFGTHGALSLSMRFVFWGGALVSALVLGAFIFFLFHLKILNGRKVEAEIASTSAFIILFGGLMLGWMLLFANFAHDTAYQVVWWQVLFEVAVITLTLMAIRIFVARTVLEKAGPSDVDPDGGAIVPLATGFVPRLMRRLPEGEKSPILWLTSENHFVEIHTKKGSVRVRMRLTDAIGEMEGVEGSCVHRSHWVAYSAIQSGRKVGGYWRLTLINGETVPVSRKYQPLLEEAGILSRLAIA